MVRPSPSTLDQAVREIADAIGASDYGRAAGLADDLLSRGAVHPFLHVARALFFERQGRDEEALAAFRMARALAPEDMRIPDAMGLCLARLHRLDEAIGVLDDAVRIAPRSASVHQHRGFVLGLAGRADAAESAYAAAARLDPRNAETLASLASIAARKGNFGRARDYAERTLALDARNASANVALAQVEIGQGAFAQAAARLRVALEDPRVLGHGRTAALALLGDALDGEGRTDEAFEAYVAANEERQRLHRHRFTGMQRAVDVLEKVIGAFAECPLERWRAQEKIAADEERSACHVFLLGFPRSGTTLLEQVLESHGEIVTLDEADFLNETAQRYLADVAGVERLSTLDEKSLGAYRNDYWRRVRDSGLNVEGKVFVDKHPFHTIKLPLIAKLFPRARVLFAVRDPRDVVFSCFRRQLDVDFLTYEFLTIESAARLYDCFMRLGELGRDRLSLTWLDCRYEDLIGDFDGITRGVCQFIGVPWKESMRSFARAAARIEAQKASAGQVRQGLYAGAVGHWRRYARHLEPGLAILEHWATRFGYGAAR